VGPDSKLQPLPPVEAPEAVAGAARNDFRARLGRALFGKSFLSGVLRSFLTLATGEWVARLIGIAIQVWLARKLTPGPYGVITFGIALIGWFGLVVDSGTEQLNVREISRRPDRFRELADTVLGLRIALSIACGAVLAVVTYEFSRSAGAREVLPRFALVLPALAINLRWMVLGIGRARAVAYGNIASRIVFLGAILLLVTAPSDAKLVPILEALSEATYAAVVIVLAAKAYGYVRPKIDLAAWKATLREGLPLLIYGACRATILTVDVVMIALILGHPQAGEYGVALKPSSFFLGAIGLFSIALLSGYSAAPDTETTSLFRRSVLLGGSTMVLVAIALTVAAPLVTFVFGHGYKNAIAATAVLAWTLPLAGLSVPYATVLVARHRQDVLMRNNIAGAVFFLAGNALLIPLVGITGAAGVRVATYALMLLVNHNACVGRGLAPSLAEVFSGRLPRLVTGRGRA
jgi:O-antigen/teichoic acid export membrane protein